MIDGVEGVEVIVELDVDVEAVIVVLEEMEDEMTIVDAVETVVLVDDGRVAVGCITTVVVDISTPYGD